MILLKILAMYCITVNVITDIGHVHGRFYTQMYAHYTGQYKYAETPARMYDYW